MFSFVVSIHGRPPASIAAILGQSAGYVLSCSDSEIKFVAEIKEIVSA